MIGRSHDQALRPILLDKLQEHVERPTHLGDIVLATTLKPERVEFIEQVDAARGLQCVEHQAQLRRALAHELGDQGVEPSHE
ncbi:hypothetical protein D9M72_549580 [compost metagenome]